jgi:hypothetical protein
MVLLEIQAGEVEVLLPNQSQWQTFTKGSSFAVSKDSSFKLKVKKVLDYCCSIGKPNLKIYQHPWTRPPSCMHLG